MDIQWTFWTSTGHSLAFLGQICSNCPVVGPVNVLYQPKFHWIVQWILDSPGYVSSIQWMSTPLDPLDNQWKTNDFQPISGMWLCNVAVQNIEVVLLCVINSGKIMKKIWKILCLYLFTCICMSSLCRPFHLFDWPIS